MKKLLLLLIVASALTVSLNAKTSKTYLGLGLFTDSVPLPSAERRNFVLNGFYQVNFVEKDGFSFGLAPGFHTFMILPMPYLDVTFSILPEPIKGVLKFGAFYDFIYGGMFAFDVKLGLEINNRVLVEFMYIPFGTQATVEYPRNMKQAFDPIKRVPREVRKGGGKDQRWNNYTAPDGSFSGPIRNHPGFVNYPIFAFMLSVRIK